MRVRLLRGLGVAVAACALPGGVAFGGGAPPKLVYTSLNPCRIVDTRRSSLGPLIPGVARTFHVVGSASDFAGQGGAAGGCGIPGFAGPTAQATAVVFNFVAVNPQGPGNLRAWATGGPVPNASIINYAQVPGLNLANGLVVPVRQDTEGDDLSVRADASGAHVVIDVVGYFYPLVITPADLPVVPISRGGTGSTTQSFVDLSTSQTVAGNKTWGGLATFGSGVDVSLSANVTGNLSVTGNTSLSGGTLDMTNTLSNAVAFGTAGVAPPSPTSPGFKLKTYGAGEYGIGVDAGAQWYSANDFHRWYEVTGGTFTQVMQLDAQGSLNVAGSVGIGGEVAPALGYRQPGPVGERLKIVRMTFDSLCNPVAGTGMTCIRRDVGTYRIELFNDFTGTPNVMIQPFCAVLCGHMTGLREVGFSHAEFYIANHAGTLVDAPFAITAIGPI